MPKVPRGSFSMHLFYISVFTFKYFSWLLFFFLESNFLIGVIGVFHFIIKQAFIKSLMLTGIVYAGLSGH